MPDALPKNSCDTHLHVFGDPKVYPVGVAKPLYEPPAECNFAALTALHRAVGIDRAVIVQATIFGTDHRLLLDTLTAAPANRYRGVAIINDTVSDGELMRLHTAGVRSARFNFGGAFNLKPNLESFRRSLERINEFGWSAKIFGFGDDFLAIGDELRRIKIPAVIDHMGALDYRLGKDQPVAKLFLDLLKRENWWIGISNGDLWTKIGPPWDDAVEFGQMFFEAAPDRCLWGSDWPHVHRFVHADKYKVGDSDYGVEHMKDLLTLLERYIPDQAARSKVLVDNPTRLFGFSA